MQTLGPQTRDKPRPRCSLCWGTVTGTWKVAVGSWGKSRLGFHFSGTQMATRHKSKQKIVYPKRMLHMDFQVCDVACSLSLKNFWKISNCYIQNSSILTLICQIKIEDPASKKDWIQVVGWRQSEGNTSKRWERGRERGREGGEKATGRNNKVITSSRK